MNNGEIWVSLADGTIMLRPVENKVGNKYLVNKNQYLMTPDGKVSRLRSDENEQSDLSWPVVRQDDAPKESTMKAISDGILNTLSQHNTLVGTWSGSWW